MVGDGGLRLPSVSLVGAGFRAEGAGVRPRLTFSTASVKHGSLGSQSPCPTSDPFLVSSPSLVFDSLVKKHLGG